MTAAERDRNTALAVARSRGRSGDERGARRWLALAQSFAEVTPRRRRAVEDAILAGRAGYIHAGQLDIDGREAPAAATG